MCSVVVAGENDVRIPADVTDLESFRRWVKLERRAGRMGHAAYELKVR